ncbi:folate-binding protein YgfZ [Erythrobacter sp. THAF29]|uniref:CAF17-like 4Fe-4S cluster assembly/insertion protein YgfZ n=1 Tax=Erythrobacter sp. THAF29 TaxID=2587851 RepID=UPI001268332D|nr:folate-binding protein YgfZ [Erythrobacter sp. THAF29]QFT77279.1 putative global regulator [Erythrobacter sp. THAF29]
MTAKRLASRAIVRLSPRDEGEDVRAFLQGLVTNDVSGNLPVYAALLSAQGKAMFDFFVWAEGDAVLLDCEAHAADDLAKRLSLYRLRRPIDIAREETLATYWGDEPFEGSSPDPRLPGLGHRAIGPVSDAEAGDGVYLAHRLSLGVPEGRAELADILWLETNAVELNGVSFDKGCYIGQENTARMNWRQKVNRRLVVVPLDQSEEKRRKTAYPDLGLAVDHLRVADLDPETLPDWQRAGIAG